MTQIIEHAQQSGNCADSFQWSVTPGVLFACLHHHQPDADRSTPAMLRSGKVMERLHKLVLACFLTQKPKNTARWQEMTQSLDRNFERSYWGWLRIQLPESGVKQRFPDERSCVRRLVEIEWPDGVKCPSCRAEDPYNVQARGLWQCRECRHQFSPTSSTMFHKSRLPLRKWFLAAELLVERTPSSFPWLLPSLSEFEDLLDLRHQTAVNLRKKVYSSLRYDENKDDADGLLAKLVLTRPAEPPSGMAPGTDCFRSWLKKEAEIRNVYLEI